MENKIEFKWLAAIAVAVVIGAVLASVFFQPAQATTERTMDKINREGKLSACYVLYPPMVIKDPNTGELSGSVVDAFNFISQETGWEIEWVEATWASFIPTLQSKQCDVVVTGLFSRIERAKSVAFTRPIVYVGNSVLVKAGETRFQNLSDFDKPNIKIAVISGEVGHLYAQKNLTNAELIVLPGADISLALSQVSSGKADAAFTDGWPVSQYAKEHPETVDFLSINPNARYGMNPITWAVRQEDTDLLAFLNTAIFDLEADGKFLEFEKKYGEVPWLRVPFKLEPTQVS